MEDIPEHVGDTYFHRAQEVARKAYGVHSNTMKIVCIADLNSATGVACYVHVPTPLAAQDATRKLNAECETRSAFALSFLCKENKL